MLTSFWERKKPLPKFVDNGAQSAHAISHACVQVRCSCQNAKQNFSQSFEHKK